MIKNRKNLIILELSGIFFLVDSTVPSHGKVVACYFSKWAEVRQGNGTLKVEDVDASQCTHLMYSIAILNKSDSILLHGNPFHIHIIYFTQEITIFYDSTYFQI